MPDSSIDALLPAEIAECVEAVGVRKAQAPAFQLFATTVAAGTEGLPYGLARLLTGLVFCLGLILVIVGGAVATACLMVITRQYTFGKDTVGIAALNTAVSKCSLGFLQAIALGIL